MSKKKILVFIDWFYPAYKAGGPVRSCLNLIEKLGTDYEFKVVTSNREYEEQKPLTGIAADEWMKHPNGLVVKYLSDPSPISIKKVLKEESPDLIWLNSMFSKNFSLIPLRLWKGKTILSPRGMLAPEALKLKKTKKAIFLKLSSILGWHKNVTFHATSEAEMKQIGAYFPSNKLFLAPNFPTPISAATSKRIKQKGTLRLVCLARIAHEKNVDVAVGRLVAMKGKLPLNDTIHFDHFGTVYDEQAYQRCLNHMKELPDSIKVNLKGSLSPELIQDTLAQYDFLLFPSRGENYGHAIVQAWNAGVPVLISDATPWKDLEKLGLGWDISNANEQKWQEVLIKCLEMGDDEYQQLSRAAQAKALQLASDPQTLVLSKSLFNS